MSTNRLLIIFVKNLEKGRVKTRLAETMGASKALGIYRKLTNYTRTVAALADADKQLWYSRFIPDEDAWDSDIFKKKLQSGNDLGARMKHAFNQAFQNGYEQVAIIGSDCPGLTSQLLEEAYVGLEDADIAIGPSQDGGYYLLGMNAFYGGLFDNITWSTPKVLPQTLAVINNMGLNACLLPERNDIDTEADWQAVKDQL